MSERAVLLMALAACSSSRGSHLYPAGSEQDDGYGDLAQSSARLWLGNSSDAGLPPLRQAPAPDAAPYDSDPDGGSADGDLDDSSAGSGDPTGSALAPSSPTVTGPGARYTIATGLTGAIEGTVTWRGSPPDPVTTACGAIEHPGARITTGRAVAGVLVTIEHVERGRAPPSVGRPARVGGLIAKRGCALVPALQIVTPLPASLRIHGDATAVRLRITRPDRALPFELESAGRVVVPTPPGVTRIEADDGSLAAAWAIATTTPYYAVTDERGRYRLDELAAGSYELTFWRPARPTLRDGKLVYGAPVTTHRKVRVTASRPVRVDLALDR